MRRYLTLAAALAGVAASAHAGTCLLSNDMLGGFTVRAVRIDTPLSLPFVESLNSVFFGSLNRRLQNLKTTLPLQPGQKFDRGKYGEGLEQISALLEATNKFSTQKVRLAVGLARVEDCDAGELTVVYRIYSTATVYNLAQMIEFDPSRITQEMAPAAAGFTNARTISPLFGYNASQGFFGGTATAWKVPLGFVQRFNASAAGASHGGGELAIGLGGEKDFGRPLLDHAEWKLDYHYNSDAVADMSTQLRPSTQLRASTLSARTLFTTRTLLGNAVVGRYGIDIEGGNRQSNLVGTQLFGTLASSAYGSLKAYVGASLAVDRTSAALSYGFQLGKVPGSTGPDFTKHLIDLELTQRWLPRVHKPVQLDGAFHAGWMPASSNNTPAVERFYGGNGAPEFVPGDTWEIQEGPILRSFPRYAFNSVSPGGPFGAARFWSANFTFAWTVRYFPAVPDETLRSADFRSALGLLFGQLNTQYVRTCQAASQPYEAVTPDLDKLLPLLPEISSWINRLKALTLPASASRLLADAENKFGDLNDNVTAAAVKPPDVFSFASASSLASTDPETSQLLVMALSSEALAKGLADTPGAGEAGAVAASAKKLREAAAKLAVDFLPVQKLNQADPAQYESTKAELKPLQTALDSVSAPLDALSFDDLATARDEVQISLNNALSQLTTAEAMDLPAGISAVLNSPTFTALESSLEKFQAALNAVPMRRDADALRLLGASVKQARDDLQAELQRTASPAGTAPAPAKEKLHGLRTALDALSNKVDLTSTSVDNLTTAQENASTHLGNSLRQLATAQSTNSRDDIYGVLDILVLVKPKVSPSDPRSLLESLQYFDTVLRNMGLADKAKTLEAPTKNVKQALDKLASKFFAVRPPPAQTCAMKDMPFVFRASDAAFRELNLFQLSPVWVFDVARLSTPRVGSTGVRYGSGPAVRFSLATLNLTVGYAWNVGRKANEPRGALFFSVSVSDIFR